MKPSRVAAPASGSKSARTPRASAKSSTTPRTSAAGASSANPLGGTKPAAKPLAAKKEDGGATAKPTLAIPKLAAEGGGGGGGQASSRKGKSLKASSPRPSGASTDRKGQKSSRGSSSLGRQPSARVKKSGSSGKKSKSSTQDNGLGGPLPGRFYGFLPAPPPGIPALDLRNWTRASDAPSVDAFAPPDVAAAPKKIDDDVQYADVPLPQKESSLPPPPPQSAAVVPSVPSTVAPEMDEAAAAAAWSAHHAAVSGLSLEHRVAIDVSAAGLASVSILSRFERPPLYELSVSQRTHACTYHAHRCSLAQLHPGPYYLAQ